MAATLSITHTQIYTDLRRYLLELFPGCEVIQGYSNNVPLPKAPFILMNIINESEMNTQISNYRGSDGLADVTRSVEAAVQLDFYGRDSGQNARIFAALWRDFHACDGLAVCKPLYADNARYIPLTNEEQEFEERWSITANLTYNPTVTHAQDFITGASVSINPII